MSCRLAVAASLDSKFLESSSSLCRLRWANPINNQHNWFAQTYFYGLFISTFPSFNVIHCRVCGFTQAEPGAPEFFPLQSVGVCVQCTAVYTGTGDSDLAWTRPGLTVVCSEGVCVSYKLPSQSLYSRDPLTQQHNNLKKWNKYKVTAPDILTYLSWQSQPVIGCCQSNLVWAWSTI